jgi:hypothetical protein
MRVRQPKNRQKNQPLEREGLMAQGGFTHPRANLDKYVQTPKV